MYCMGVSASETHSRKNTGMPIAEATERIIAMAKEASVSARVQVSVQSAFGCGFEGEVAEARVLDIVRRFVGADGLVLVKASASASAAELRALVTGIASSVETGGVAKAAPPATASTIDDTTEATAVLRAVVGALRRHLGGPVVRNYLRRNLPSEGPARAYLAAFAIGLDASLTPPTSAPPKGATQAIGVWAASVLADGQGIIPALAELSLRDIAGDRAPTLAPSGFFDPPPAPPIGAA